MPSIDMDEFKKARGGKFTTEEWIDIILRSTGMEPDKLNEREKMVAFSKTSTISRKQL